MGVRTPWVTAQLVFIHVPKAAGTSFTRLLEGRFEQGDVCPAYYWSELLQIPRARLLRYRLIRGHFAYCVVELLRDVRVLTLLRDPVSRAISYYRYIRSNPEHPLHEEFRRKSLLQVLEDPDLARPICNGQTFLFGQDMDLEEFRRKRVPEAPPVFPANNSPGGNRLSLQRALERIETCAFVGIQERFEDALLLLAYTFGWPPFAASVRVNVTPHTEDDPGHDRRVVEALRKRNELDLQLYDRAKRVFEERFENMCLEIAEAVGMPRGALTRERITAAVRELATQRSPGSVTA